MKRKSLILIPALLIAFSAYSQNVDDALRYSQLFLGGTGRVMGMGGAFTSLGADLSALSLNPAGIGMFRSVEISVTPDLLYNSSTSAFNGTGRSDFRYAFGLSQAGVAATVYSSGNQKGLVNLNAAYSYNRTNSFNQNTTISGISDNSSMADYWAISSEGIRFNNLTGAAGIAYDTWIIDTITGSGQSSYGTVFSHYGDSTYSSYGQTIRRIITNDGFSGEHAISFGGNFSEMFFFGLTFGISQLNYMGHYEHLEADYDDVVYTDFKNFLYTDHFDARGTGYSLKLGTIIRPVSFLRIGAAFHSPTIYHIEEYFYDYITSEFDTPDSEGNSAYEASNDPYTYSYTLTTPWRAMAGASVQLGKIGIISADYEYVDYTMAKFSHASDGYDYYNENQSIMNILKSATNLRFGAEVRLSSLYLRGGYGYYGSAFKDGELNQDLVYNSYNGGIGFRQKGMFFDIGFAHIKSDTKYLMYSDEPYLQPTSVAIARTNVTVTMGFKF